MMSRVETAVKAPLVPPELPLPASSTSARGACNPTALFGRGSSGTDRLELMTALSPCDSGPHLVGEMLPEPPPDGFRHFANEEIKRFVVSEVNVPGSNASDIRIHSVWHAMPRQVLRTDCGFARFFQAMHTSPREDYERSSTASLWPMPLPYRLGRAATAEDDNKEVAFKKAVNLQVAFLDYLHLNKPRSPPPEICGKRVLSPAQQSVVRRLRRLSEAWHKMDVICADEMGRVAAKQERLEEILGYLATVAKSAAAGVNKYHRVHASADVAKPVSEHGKVVGRLRKGDTGGAQAIIASHIKMEGKPCFDPLPFLDEDAAQLYEHPFSCGINPDDFIDRPPRVRIHATHDERVKLFELLEQSGRLAFCSPHEVHAGFGNGMFCVPKSTKVDRLILDGRPANLLQKPPNKFIMTMASPSAILGIRLKDDEKLIMSGDDLSNFFYTFRVNDSRAGRNFLDWKIPIKVAQKFKSFPSHLSNSDYVYPCLASLAMGDSAACDYAQTSHISMALQCNALGTTTFVDITR